MVTNNKLREALEAALKTIRGVINSTISPHSNTVFDCRDELLSALAEPIRNCDVGTRKTQRKRFLEFCIKQDCDHKCPFRNGNDHYECALGWAQLPYESEAAK